MTDKQKQARLANLEAGRKKRKEMIAQKNEEYDLSSEDSSETESDNEAFVISKKTKTSRKEILLGALDHEMT